MDNSVQLIYYSREYDADYFPQEEALKIWNDWYNEHKYRLEQCKRLSPL